jgi:hypothetical protein
MNIDKARQPFFVVPDVELLAMVFYSLFPSFSLLSVSHAFTCNYQLSLVPALDRTAEVQAVRLSGKGDSRRYDISPLRVSASLPEAGIHPSSAIPLSFSPSSSLSQLLPLPFSLISLSSLFFSLSLCLVSFFLVAFY